MKATEHKDTGEKMHVYEVGYLVVPNLTEEKATSEASAIRSLVEGNGGVVISEEFPKIRDLAYSMSKVVESVKTNYNQAYFGWIKFDLPVLNLAKIESQLRESKNILRHLIIKTIRENTIFSPRVGELTVKRPDEEAPKEGPISPPVTEDKKPVSQDEIDKSIDALVIS